MNNKFAISAKVSVCLILMFVGFSSCMTTKTSVGNYIEQKGSTYTYAKGKQVWAFWGVVPLGRTSVNTPSDGDCQVITRLNIADLLISGFTAGIITTSTIKVKAKKKSN